MLWSPPPAEKLAKAGLSRADFKSPELEIWPDNVEVMDLYCRLGSQWRVGMNGPTGLDLTVFFHELDRLGISGPEYETFLNQLRVIEGAALRIFHSK